MKTITAIAALIFTGSVACAATSKNGFVLDDALIPVDEISQGGPGRDGKEIPSVIAFWFAWPAFHGNTTICAEDNT
jgi:hypothetical protein